MYVAFLIYLFYLRFFLSDYSLVSYFIADYLLVFGELEFFFDTGEKMYDTFFGIFFNIIKTLFKAKITILW